MMIAPVINTGTFGVAPQDAGVASATVTVGQQLGASVGTSLLNTIFAAAVTSYITGTFATARLIGRQAPDRAGPGARLRHRVLVDRRHLRRRRGHRRHPAPSRATGSEADPAPAPGIVTTAQADDPRAWLAQLRRWTATVRCCRVAGQQLSVAATRRTLARIEDLFGGHLSAPIELLSQAVAPHMQQQGSGTIVHVTARPGALSPARVAARFCGAPVARITVIR